MTGDGLQITAGGHVTRPKWHRLRRHHPDREFGAAVPAEGFRLGALMEASPQVQADGGLVASGGDLPRIRALAIRLPDRKHG